MSDVHRAIASRLSSLRDSFNRGMSAFDTPGPELRVRPFAAGAVTPEGGVLKALTMIAATRRASANFREQRMAKARDAAYRDLQMRSLEQKLNEPTYSIDGPDGRPISGLSGPEYVDAWKKLQPAAEKPDDVTLTPSDVRVLGLPPSPTGKYDRQTVLARQATQRIVDARALHAGEVTREADRDARREKSRSRYTAAVAGLRSLDSEEERGAEKLWNDIQPRVQQALASLQAGGERAKQAARVLGVPIDNSGVVYAEDIAAAVKSLKEETLARGKQIVRRRIKARRDAFQGVIDTEGGALLDAAPTTSLSPSAQAVIDALNGATN